MPKKQAAPPPGAGVTVDRATRLLRLIRLLGTGPQQRSSITRKLRLGIRGYYRDLEVIRSVGIVIEFSNGRYRLVDEVNFAIERLPFPDPGLNVGEARTLAKGRSAAHKRIREQLVHIER